MHVNLAIFPNVLLVAVQQTFVLHVRNLSFGIPKMANAYLIAPKVLTTWSQLMAPVSLAVSSALLASASQTLVYHVQTRSLIISTITSALRVALRDTQLSQTLTNV